MNKETNSLSDSTPFTIDPITKKSAHPVLETESNLPEILFITSYPPRECGIATYSQDLIFHLNKKFNHSFKLSICALETKKEAHSYTDEIAYILNTDCPDSYHNLSTIINESPKIQIVMIQHEFGLFQNSENYFNPFLKTLNKPIVIAFHSVLPHPDTYLKVKVQEIAELAQSVVVMTHSSKDILTNEYNIPSSTITVIPHGTHLVPHTDRELLKLKHQLSNKKILSTFGLLSSGKSIETTLEALPEISKKNPEVLFLIIGKTHPNVVKQEGEKYRGSLEAKIETLQLEPYVKFINSYLPLPDLLEYLQLTDIYLFTSNDPNQAVSGTFSYAISCGCAIVSTPIPHVNEVLQHNIGLRIDFGNSKQLEKAVNQLLENEELRKNFSSNGLHRMASTAWENTAISHALLFEKLGSESITLQYTLPLIDLNHIKKMTTSFGIIQFSKINQPDIDSGYTLDDNARALIAICQHYELTKEAADLTYIQIYYNFIKHCLLPEGYFQNYVNEQKSFTKQNNTTNLADANGRAIWALGYLLSISEILPDSLVKDAETTLQRALFNVNKIHSTRAMAFIIKGLYYYNIKSPNPKNKSLIKELANRLVQMYRHEADDEWFWFESYFTYANSILSEALLCAWLATGDQVYKEIAKSSFDFLLSLTFQDNKIRVISNKTWLHKGAKLIQETANNPLGGEQPIDVAYTILALSKFHHAFENEKYLHKMEMSFNWFLGNNHLNQIIYNPCTGGCYDGLEDQNINLNQGAESTISYLMARLAVEKTLQNVQKTIPLTATANIEETPISFIEINGY